MDANSAEPGVGLGQTPLWPMAGREMSTQQLNVTGNERKWEWLLNSQSLPFPY